MSALDTVLRQLVDDRVPHGIERRRKRKKEARPRLFVDRFCARCGGALVPFDDHGHARQRCGR